MTMWNDFVNESARKYLKELLRENNIEVTFEKSDGTERKMVCTLQENKIPENKKPKNSGKKVSEDVLPVFDLELGDWRSFRYKSIKYFTIIS